jgi:hypothetical protein
MDLFDRSAIARAEKAEIKTPAPSVEVTIPAFQKPLEGDRSVICNGQTIKFGKCEEVLEMDLEGKPESWKQLLRRWNRCNGTSEKGRCTVMVKYDMFCRAHVVTKE